jgi:hypothetical protein
VQPLGENNVLKVILTTVIVGLGFSASAEQYLGAPGDQGKAAGFGGYQGTFVGYFSTRPMRDAFRTAAHLTSLGVVTKAVPKAVEGRVVGYTIGAKYYAMAIGPIQTAWAPTDYSAYSHVGIPNSGGWDYIGGGAWSWSNGACNSQGC